MARPLLCDHWERTGQQQAQRYPHPHVKAAGICIRHLPSTSKTDVAASLPVHLKRWPLLSHAFQGRHWLLTRKTLSWDSVFGPLLDNKQSRYWVDECTRRAPPGRSPVLRYRCCASTGRRCNSPEQPHVQYQIA